ncbi:MAG TPA: prolyl oligopeptidase family serine peptidase [Rudaea sp.]|nr:prolyl oligopeptidase family serine peptidase [Rudaea sp.]
MSPLRSFVFALAIGVFAPAVSAGVPQRMTFDVGSTEREALVFSPAAGGADEKHPLVFAFHGHGGNMRGFAQAAELQSHWPQAIVVYPQGLPTPSRIDAEGTKPGWQARAGEQADRDLKFVDAMLASLRKQYRVDDQHVFATGFSNGAFFSMLLWLERSNDFAGFAVVGGGLHAGMTLPVPKPVLHIAGETDPLVTPSIARFAIAEEQRADAAPDPGENCGAGCTLFHGKADVKTVWHPGGHIYPPQAAELTVEFFRTSGGAHPAAPPAATAVADGPKGDIVQYQSRGVELMAFVYKPAGKGPFPVYMWNHGGERDPMPGALLAKFWVPRGFVLYAPLRSGHGPNPGAWIGDEQKRIREQRSPAGFHALMELHEHADDDVVAAYQWIAHQPFADAKHIVVAGASYGGIQALLAAERDPREHLGVKCVVAMSPAAESWGNPHWAQRLGDAVDAARAPIFLLQAQNDYSLGPSESLGPRIDAKGGANRHKVFPAHGDPNDHTQGHAGFFADAGAWGDDVLKFLHDCGEI